MRVTTNMSIVVPEYVKTKRKSDEFEAQESKMQFSAPAPFAKWGWSLRGLQDLDNEMSFDERVPDRLSPGDVALAEIGPIGHHARIYTRDKHMSRLYEGDVIVGVVGHRYATDAFHAPDIDPRRLNLLTNAGLLGTVKERHTSTKPPTKLRLRGVLVDRNSAPVNLRTRLFQVRPLPLTADAPLVLVIGTGMNSGKTTVLSKVGHALAARGKSVGLLKLTGSVTHRDLHEYSATGAAFVRDFSDYGFPSTYLVPDDLLHTLAQTMIADATAARPDVIMAEIADGVLQRETQSLIRYPLISRLAKGAILSATCAPSALTLVDEVSRLGYTNFVISGTITNSPLATNELSTRSKVPVMDCHDRAADLADRVLAWLGSASTVLDPVDVAAAAI